ncbi:hypothetical protein J4Q44_G00390960 [Coregonus suidteri]|uniref:Uncharacterized protein n=1 Tax=Coregonus suidteri TaxID=861788 RepID=A0AAN8KDT4_9TELE
METSKPPPTKRSELRKQKPQSFQEAIAAGDQPLRSQSQASSERSLGQLEGPSVACDGEDIEHLLADEPINIQESPRRVTTATPVSRSEAHPRAPRRRGDDISVTDQTGNRIYLPTDRRPRQRQVLEEFSAPNRGYFNSQVDEEFGELDGRQREEGDGEEEDGESSRLWVDQFSPQHYTELLSDDFTNRCLLKWLKLWDQVLFQSSRLHGRDGRQRGGAKVVVAKPGSVHRSPRASGPVIGGHGYWQGQSLQTSETRSSRLPRQHIPAYKGAGRSPGHASLRRASNPAGAMGACPPN